MFDILMYLFENYIQNESAVAIKENELTEELKQAGFDSGEIYKALDWLEQLADLQYSDEYPYLNHAPVHSIRIFTESECDKLDITCRGFLMFLEQVALIDSVTREMVIDRLFDIEKSELTLDDVKWVVLMVLFNVPGQEAAYAQMEELVFEGSAGRIH